jgi:hypothetical protein
MLLVTCSCIVMQIIPDTSTRVWMLRFPNSSTASHTSHPQVILPECHASESFVYSIQGNTWLLASCHLKENHLFVVLGQKLLAQLDVLVLSLLLACASINNLLPLVVLGLALACMLAMSIPLRYVVSLRRAIAVEGRKTYSQVEHAGLLCGAKVLALSDLGVRVELQDGDVSRCLVFLCM